MAPGPEQATPRGVLGVGAPQPLPGANDGAVRQRVDAGITQVASAAAHSTPGSGVPSPTGVTARVYHLRE